MMIQGNRSLLIALMQAKEENQMERLASGKHSRIEKTNQGQYDLIINGKCITMSRSTMSDVYHTLMLANGLLEVSEQLRQQGDSV